MLQQLLDQQRQDRLAAEEARRAQEAKLAELQAHQLQLQRDAARDKTESEQRMLLMFDRITQRSDAHIQQLQQGLMGVVGMVSQLITHSGLDPRQFLTVQSSAAASLLASAPATAAGSSQTSTLAPLQFSVSTGPATLPVPATFAAGSSSQAAPAVEQSGMTATATETTTVTAAPLTETAQSLPDPTPETAPGSASASVSTSSAAAHADSQSPTDEPDVTEQFRVEPRQSPTP